MFKNKKEFTELIDKIKKEKELFLTKDIDYTRYTLNVASGNTYEIDYNIASLPHLLGVNTSYLASTNLYKGKAYEILEKILNNSNSLYNQINDGHIKKERVFSKRIHEKLKNFEDICTVNIFNIEFIVEYDRTRNYTSGEQKLDGDLYIAYRKKQNDSNISILGLIQNEDGLYVPQTNLIFVEHTNEARDFFKQLLKNQNVTIASTLIKKRLSENNEVKKYNFYYQTEIKNSKTRTLKRYAENYDCTIDVNQDYIHQTKLVCNLKDDKLSTFDILDKITENISKAKEINLKKVKKKYRNLSTSIENLITTYNETITNPNNNDAKYNALRKQLEQMQEEQLKKDKLIEKIDANSQKLKQENENLMKENQDLKEKHKQIKKILG